MTRFCALDGGSFTELPTNTVVLDEIRTEEHLTALLTGKLPIDLLPTVLHELTHHWCFFSAVGNVLATLRARFQQRCMTVTEQAPIFEDLFRFETVTAALRPIAEGLALFAEFDVLPGHCDLRSEPLAWILALFRRDALVGGVSAAESDSILGELLSAPRRDERLWRKKESLLVKELHVGGGGYLAGYLGVKALWERVRQEAPDVADPELFWAYVRAFFFEDESLIAVMLNPQHEAAQPVLAILDHVSARIKLLQQADLGTSLRTFLKDASQRRREWAETQLADDVILHEAPPLQGISVDEATVAVARERVKSLMLEVRNAPGEVAQLIVDGLRFSLARRDLVCLASAPMRITINEHGRVLMHVPGGMMSLGAAPDEQPRTADGVFELYYATIPIWLAAVAVIDGRPVSAAPIFGKNSDIASEDALRLLLDRSRILRFEKDTNEDLEGFIAMQAAGPWAIGLREEAEKILSATYAEWALQRVPEDRHFMLRAMMQDRGFWNILDQKLPLIRAVATAGVLQNTVVADGDIETLVHSTVDAADLTEANVSASVVDFPLLKSNALLPAI